MTEWKVPLYRIYTDDEMKNISFDDYDWSKWKK